jgi:predicted RNase H-like nuclease (RuvC/YqgF family)
MREKKNIQRAVHRSCVFCVLYCPTITRALQNHSFFFQNMNSITTTTAAAVTVSSKRLKQEVTSPAAAAAAAAEAKANAEEKREKQAGRKRMQRMRQSAVDRVQKQAPLAAQGDQRVDELCRKLSDKRTRISKLAQHIDQLTQRAT